MSLVMIAAVDLILLALGVLGTIRYGVEALSFAVPAIGIVTFFGTLQLAKPLPDDEGIRRAVAIAVVTVYLVLVGAVAFLAVSETIPPITESLIGSFTATVAVVIAFYFGATAYLDARRGAKESNT